MHDFLKNYYYFWDNYSYSCSAKEVGIFVCFFLLKLFPQLVSDTFKQTHLSIEY